MQINQIPIKILAGGHPHTMDGAKNVSLIESAEFGQMLEAFSAARTMRPTLTLNALRGVLVVCAHPGEMTYAEFAEHSHFSEKPKLNYMFGASMIAQLSDGRGKYPGLELCERRPGMDRRQKVVYPSADGALLAGHFLRAAGIEDAEEGREWIRTTLLPALDGVMKKDPGLALSTFCVLLDIGHNAKRFEGGAEYSNKIAKRLGVNNLPNHMARLAGTPRGKANPTTHPALIKMLRVEHDHRARWPVLTERGQNMTERFAWALLPTADLVEA